MKLLLDEGQRGFIVGQTGSGKTQDAIFHLRNTPHWPIVIFDTKIEDDFFGVPAKEDTFQLIENVSDFEYASKQKRKDMHDYYLVRPSMNEITDVDALNQYTEITYYNFGPVYSYFDEAYNWHNNGKCGPGLIALLTRGRSKKKTTMLASQRPMWVSRFCLTETQKFYIHLLQDGRDVKALSEVVPGLSELAMVPKHHFHHYAIGMESPVLFSPVPYQKLNPSALNRGHWL